VRGRRVKKGRTEAEEERRRQGKKKRKAQDSRFVAIAACDAL